MQRDDADEDREDPEAREERDLLMIGIGAIVTRKRPAASFRIDTIAGGNRCEYDFDDRRVAVVGPVVLLVVPVHRLHECESARADRKTGTTRISGSRFRPSSGTSPSAQMHDRTPENIGTQTPGHDRK
jgi:hypothetical protein